MIVREIPPETSPDAALAMKRAALRVLTWNVQHASAARGLRQAAWLAAQPDADVIALTEVAGGASGDSLAQSLAAHGYRVHLPVSGGATTGCCSPLASASSR